MNNRRAVSGVITTLLLITVAIVAIGIVALVILNAVGSGEQTIDFSQKCLGAQFKISGATATATGCNVVVERASGLSTESVDGIILTVNNDATSLQTDVSGDVVATATLVEEGCTETTVIARVDGVAYFTKEDDTQHLCTPFSFEAA